MKLKSYLKNVLNKFILVINIRIGGEELVGLSVEGGGEPLRQDVPPHQGLPAGGTGGHLATGDRWTPGDR